MASAPITETHLETKTSIPTEIQANNHTRQFDLKIVRDSFVECIQSDRTLRLREYVRAYEELCL
jgi:hypothetical protein